MKPSENLYNQFCDQFLIHGLVCVAKNVALEKQVNVTFFSGNI